MAGLISSSSMRAHIASGLAEVYWNSPAGGKTSTTQLAYIEQELFDCFMRSILTLRRPTMILIKTDVFSY